MPIGCARVSTQDQNLESQREAVTKAGASRSLKVGELHKQGIEFKGLTDAFLTRFAIPCVCAFNAAFRLTQPL